MIELLLHSFGEFSTRQPLTPTIWPHYDLLFVHSGRLSIYVETIGKVRLHAGEGVLLFPETKFSPHNKNSEALASVQHFSLDPQNKVLPPPFSHLVSKRTGCIVYKGSNNEYLENDIKRAIKWAKLPSTPARTTMRKALLTLILGEFLQIGWKDKPQQGLKYGTENLLEWAANQPLADLTTEKLAHAAGVSESTLRRQFHKHCDMSPKQAITSLRFNAAKQLLTETAKPIKEIAVHVGYKSDIAFHTAFKNRFQTSPGSYRQKHRITG